MSLLLLALLLCYEFLGSLQGDGERVLGLGYGDILLLVEHVWAEASCAYDDLVAVVHAQCAWQLEELEGLVEGYCLHRLV